MKSFACRLAAVLLITSTVAVADVGAATLFNADFDSIPVAQYNPATAAFNADTSMVAGSSWSIEEGTFAEIYVQSSSADAAKHAVNSDNVGNPSTSDRGLTANFVGPGGEFTGNDFTDIQFVWGRSRTGGTNQEKEYFAKGKTAGGATEIFSLNWDSGDADKNKIFFNGTELGTTPELFQAANSLWNADNFLLVDIRMQEGLADVAIRNAGDNSLLFSSNNLALNSTAAIDQLEFDNVFFAGVNNVGFWIDNVNVTSGAVPEPSTLLLVSLGCLAFVRRRRR